MPAGYVAACLRAIDEERDAGSVGGWREPRGRGPWGRALAAALASPLGVGHALIWRRPARGSDRREVEHVPLGCFRAETLRAVGGWREELATNEDFDLDHRLRRAGGRVVFDPEIWSVYYARESLGAIARQYWRYGRWKAAMLVSAPESLQPRQLAPPALVATVLAGVVVAAGTGRAAGALRLRDRARSGGCAGEAGWRSRPCSRRCTSPGARVSCADWRRSAGAERWSTRATAGSLRSCRRTRAAFASCTTRSGPRLRTRARNSSTRGRT